jgi:hypothetical protein
LKIGLWIDLLHDFQISDYSEKGEKEFKDGNEAVTWVADILESLNRLDK